jgi:hypothetical protein
MTDFIVKRLPYDLSNQAGLALIGKYLKHIQLNALVDPAYPVRSGIANSDILKSYLGLLCLGKNDFEAIESQRKDTFFARALDLRAVPSSPTLRQRLDTHAASWFDLADRINAAVLGLKVAGKPIDFGVLPCGYVPLDVWIFRPKTSQCSGACEASRMGWIPAHGKPVTALGWGWLMLAGFACEVLPCHSRGVPCGRSVSCCVCISSKASASA